MIDDSMKVCVKSSSEFVNLDGYSLLYVLVLFVSLERIYISTKSNVVRD
jgi:hypothetical protein